MRNPPTAQMSFALIASTEDRKPSPTDGRRVCLDHCTPSQCRISGWFCPVPTAQTSEVDTLVSPDTEPLPSGALGLLTSVQAIWQDGVGVPIGRVPVIVTVGVRVIVRVRVIVGVMVGVVVSVPLAVGVGSAHEYRSIRLLKLPEVPIL